jgi:ribose 5-phosphate isomerase
MLSSRMAVTGSSTPRLAGLTIRNDPKAMAHALSGVPGVMEHGLFIDLAQMAIIGGPDGIKIIERS